MSLRAWAPLGVVAGVMAMAIWWAPAKEPVSAADAVSAVDAPSKIAAVTAPDGGLHIAADLAVSLSARTPGRVTVQRLAKTVRAESTFELLRTTSARDADAPGGVTRFTLDADPALLPFEDKGAPDGIKVTYVLEATTGGATELGPAMEVETPQRSLPTRLAAPRLVIDKAGYTLSVLDGEAVVRRYPVGLGADPVKRKLFQDNATTPEGEYRIHAVQSRATYYRAYDLDYPTATDRLRYAEALRSGLVPKDARKARPIGGEIQIHGGGVASNWTHGCIALRNGDIDELMARPAIRRGTRVTIYGSEVQPIR